MTRLQKMLSHAAVASVAALIPVAEATVYVNTTFTNPNKTNYLGSSTGNVIDGDTWSFWGSTASGVTEGSTIVSVPVGEGTTNALMMYETTTDMNYRWMPQAAVQFATATNSVHAAAILASFDFYYVDSMPTSVATSMLVALKKSDTVMASFNLYSGLAANARYHVDIATSNRGTSSVSDDILTYTITNIDTGAVAVSPTSIAISGSAILTSGWLSFTLGEWTNTTSAFSPNILIDNVLITSNPVPEPAALGFVAVASACCLLAKRR